MLKRVFDVLLSLILIIVFAIPLILLGIAVKLTSPGPILHWSKRIGRNNKIFLMPKFRSMKVDTPQVATHLMQDPTSYLTPIGSFLRKSSLDELPQLWPVLIGEMSFVGPRPALFNQDDLTEMRTTLGVHRLRPGITGWAQINGRDELALPAKVEYDRQYLEKMSMAFDCMIIFKTFLRVFNGSGESH